MNTERQEAAGIRFVQQIVREEWLCRWQELDARNDDAIDGLIFYKKKKLVVDTIYAQVKCGVGYRIDSANYPDHICINLGKKYIEKHKDRWVSLPGPVILIYVEPGSKSKNDVGWWTDLKNIDSYSSSASSYIIIPKDQKFDISAKKKLYNLTSHRYQESILTNIDIDNSLLWNINLGKSIKKIGMQNYKFLSQQTITPKCREIGVNVIFSRVGWRHITRKTRSLHRIFQSFILLPLAKEIIETVENYEIVNYYYSEDKRMGIVNHFQTILLRSRVSFSFRYPTVINLILKRKITININEDDPVDSKVWFYSIYESKRGRELVR